MKNIGTALVFLFLLGCGMSEGEKQQLAISTCNVISSAAGDDSTARLKELNSARQQLGESLYTGSDDDIRDSVKFGICESLVLNDPAHGSLVAQNREMIAAEQKRVDGVAAITCSIISETRNMDAAVRIKEINAARVEIGEDPYLEGDEAVKESVKYGLCEQLVKNDPDYDTLLEEMQRLEREAIAAQRKREREREERLAREKKERERIPQERWRTALLKYMGDFKPYISEIEWDRDAERLEIWFSCGRIEGLERSEHYTLVDGLGTLEDDSSIGACFQTIDRETKTFPFVYRSTMYASFGELSDELIGALNNTSDYRSLIKSAHVKITGVHRLQNASANRKLSSSNFPPLGNGASLANPIRVEISLSKPD